MRERLRVLLLFGGRSAEHDVSRTTAVAVAGALDPERYEIVPVAITVDGRWLLADAAQREIASGPSALPAQFAVDGTPASGIGDLVADPGSRATTPSRGGFDVDVVFPLLHGPYGEDGTVQGLLELADLPYVGSGVVGSAVGMDKVMMKRALIACGVPTPAHLGHWAEHPLEPFVAQVERELGYPCFVKPANLGSSVGVSKAHDRGELEAACATALAFDEWIIVEESIDGREIEVAVLGDNPPEVSVPGEIVPGDEFYSYADKYESDTAQLLIPAPLSDEQTTAARSLALEAFAACRLEGMARVDLFLEEQRADGTPGRGFMVNEVNTIPGFTPISMYPKLWAESGVSYPALLDRLIELAFARHARRAQRAGRQR
ncbi:MAG TPA: D-alanine--D-alanine ligase family protein [Acidimicrobiia bacterium]|nr:D-alanine--D-alanine ligase family protein [Acidimicrobiia bacterium]